MILNGRLAVKEIIYNIIVFVPFLKKFKDRHITIINSIGLLVEILAMGMLKLLFVANM